MYALNTLLRLINTVSRLFVGLVLGFILGYMFARGGLDVSALDLFLK